MINTAGLGVLSPAASLEKHATNKLARELHLDTKEQEVESR